MKSSPPRSMFYLQVKYDPPDKTKDARNINATTILTIFMDTTFSKMLVLLNVKITSII
jgi:hypothetical protein